MTHFHLTSTGLFATPRFLTGMGTVLDIGATLTMYNGFASPEEADREAIRSDWEIVGRDINSAMEQWETGDVE